jgi:toxin FitB
MFLLDTNVISELRKAKSRKADRNVLRWAESTSTSSLFLSVISILELEIGILRVERKAIPQGKILRHWLNEQLLPAFTSRIISMDIAIAQACAKLHVPNPCSGRDAIIAATALAHGFTVVTGNTADFSGTGVSLLNPWDDSLF